MKRKVVQLLMVQDTDYQQGCFMALCDDGTIWDRRIMGRGELAHYEWCLIDGPPEVIE